jgi:hypothetical protein
MRMPASRATPARKPAARRKPRRQARPPAPEAEVLRQCLRLLELRGIPHWRNNTGGVRRGKRYVAFGTPGAPDVMGILAGGRLLCLECKGTTGRLSAAQKAWLKRAEAAGALVVVARSVEDLAEALDRKGA